MDYEKMGDAMIKILARTFQELLTNVVDIQGEIKPKSNLEGLLQENHARELVWEYQDNTKQLSMRENNSYVQKIYLQSNPCHAQIILVDSEEDFSQEEKPSRATLENKVATIAVMDLDKNVAINILDILDLNNRPADEKANAEGINLLYSLFEKFSGEEFKEKIREELDDYGFEKVFFEDAKREVKIEMVSKLLIAKFSELPSDYVKKLHNVSVEKLDSIITNAFRLKSLNDLDEYL